jgi:DNA mismatch repair protein MutS
MPSVIVKRAETVLEGLERSNTRDGSTMPKGDMGATPSGGAQLSFFQLDDPVLQQIRDEILHLDVNNLTPMESLNKLHDIQKILKGR